MPQSIVLLNGPPRSGKDTLAEELALALGHSHMKFAQPLRDAIPAIFGLSQSHWNHLLEEHKGKASLALMGRTPREAMIWLSESVCKPAFGEAFFGYQLAGRITRGKADRVIVSDSGFQAEAMVLIDQFGAENIRLIRLHRDHCTFAGDSRNYVDLPVPTLDLQNNGPVVQMALEAAAWLTSQFAEKSAA